MKIPASSHPLTLAHAFEQFLDASSFARRTRESYAEDLAPLLAEVGQQPVRVLTADILHAFLARQESLAPATYNRRLAALRSFIRWRSQQGWLTEALLDGMERKPEGKRVARALDAQKVESVLRKIENPRDRALFWLIYDGGLRCQEALAIDIEDISWPDRSIRLHGKGDLCWLHVISVRKRDLPELYWLPECVHRPAHQPTEGYLSGKGKWLASSALSISTIPKRNESF